LHKRSIGIKNPPNFDGQSRLAMPSEEKGLGAALPFLIAGTGLHGVYPTPVSLVLRVNFRISI